MLFNDTQHSYAFSLIEIDLRINIFVNDEQFLISPYSIMLFPDWTTIFENDEQS